MPTNMKVNTTSVIAQAYKAYRPGGWVPYPLAANPPAQVKPCLTTGDHVKESQLRRRHRLTACRYKRVALVRGNGAPPRVLPRLPGSSGNPFGKAEDKDGTSTDPKTGQNVAIASRTLSPVCASFVTRCVTIRPSNFKPCGVAYAESRDTRPGQQWRRQPPPIGCIDSDP